MIRPIIPVEPINPIRPITFPKVRIDILTTIIAPLFLLGLFVFVMWIMLKANEDKFKNESKGHDAADQLTDAGEGEVARRLHQHLAVIQAHPLADGKGNQGDDGHKAQTAQLDQKQYDDLPEGRPAGEGVADDQTRHAGGAGGGEQRVKEV